MRSIFGHSYGTYVKGTMTLNGKEVRLRNVPAAIDAGLAYVTEDRKSLGLNLLDDIKTTTVSAKLKKIAKNLVVDRRAEHTAAEEYRKALRTKTPSVDYGVAKLSGGNQQKVVLAKWLFTDPDLLILDEPTRGIDVGAKYEIYGIIQRLARPGQGRHRRLLRAARAARPLRPDLHDLRRPDHRRPRQGRGRPGVADAPDDRHQLHPHPEATRT